MAEDLTNLEIISARTKLMELERDVAELKHNNKMRELKQESENIKLFHQCELERIRVKSAEIKRQQDRKRANWVP
jgi:hypothetical protein